MPDDRLGKVFGAVFAGELGQQALAAIASHCRDGQRLYALGSAPADLAYLLGRQEVAIWIREAMARATTRDEE